MTFEMLCGLAANCKFEKRQPSSAEVRERCPPPDCRIMGFAPTPPPGLDSPTNLKKVSLAAQQCADIRQSPAEVTMYKLLDVCSRLRLYSSHLWREYCEII